MTSARTKTTANPASPPAAGETPWYEFINDAPEPPEDAMQQEDTILDVMSVLKARYENVPGALWCSQSNVIYDSYTPGSVVAPDGCIVLGLKTDAKAIKRNRRSYRIDEWGVPPAFVLEVGSPSTAARDLGEKRALYARMGAQEYWRLDRYGESYRRAAGGRTPSEQRVCAATSCTPSRMAQSGPAARCWAWTSSAEQQRAALAISRCGILPRANG